MSILPIKSKEQWIKEFDFQREVIELLLAQQNGESNPELYAKLVAQSSQFPEATALAIIEESRQSVVNSLKNKEVK